MILLSAARRGTPRRHPTPRAITATPLPARQHPPPPPRTPDPAPLISPMARDRLHSLTPRLEFLDATLRMVHTYTRVYMCLSMTLISELGRTSVARDYRVCIDRSPFTLTHFLDHFFALNCKRSFPLLVVSRATNNKKTHTYHNFYN